MKRIHRYDIKELLMNILNTGLLTLFLIVWAVVMGAVCIAQAEPATIPITGTADVSSIQQQIDELRGQQEANTTAIGELQKKVEGNAGGGGNSDTSDETDTVGDNSGGKETDLWINVSHQRYTPVIEYRDGAYVITDLRFVELMGKWSGIRYLNWTGQLYKDRNWTWSNRVRETDADLWDSTGVPLEAIIAVANATHTHVWWCAPQQADLDYMRRAGDLFARTLDPDLNMVVEIGNEVWQSDRGWRYDDLSVGPDGKRNFGRRMQLYAQDSAAKFRAFIEGPPEGVGFPADRLTRVIGGQLHNIGVLKSNALKHIDPADYDAISCSGYFGSSPGDYVDGSGGLKASLSGLRAHAALAEQYGKQLLIYEINQHIDRGTSDMAFVDTDPVIDGVRTMLAAARDEGAKTITVYSGVGRAYPNAPFPIYTDDYQPRRIVTELGWPTLGN